MSAPLSAMPDDSPRVLPERDAPAALLRGHPDVIDVGAFAVPDPRRTVVAVVPGPLASMVDLRDHLWNTLPADALPDLLVMVDELPADGAGLVTALDQPGSLTFRVPGTPTEVAIAGVWSEVLGRAHIGADDNFLDLGGDSMTAALLLDLTNERLGVELTLGDLLAVPSLAALAETVDAKK